MLLLVNPLSNLIWASFGSGYESSLYPNVDPSFGSGQLLTLSAVSLGLLLPWLLLELHVAKVHDGTHYFIAAILLVEAEAKDVHGILWKNGGKKKKQGFGVTAGCRA